MKVLDIDPRTDQQLLEAIKQGSMAERVLYERYAAYAINLASRLVRNRAQAEEATQDVWLALYRRLKKAQPPTELKPYLAAMIINRCRKLSRAVPESISLDMEALAHIEEVQSHWFALDENTLGGLEQDELKSALSERMRRLSDVERKAIELRYFHEFSYAEAAEALGKSEAYARLIVHRALGVLKNGFERGKK